MGEQLSCSQAYDWSAAAMNSGYMVPDIRNSLEIISFDWGL